MAKWNIVRRLDEIKSDLKNLYIKKSQKEDINYIIWELENVQEGIIEHMKDKSKWNKFIERHFAKEVHPNADI
jgi:hypothetical protein